MFERILVTGFSGYVGPWVLMALRRRFPRARLIGAARRPDVRIAAGGLPDETAALDLCDARSIEKVVKSARPDAVVHLASLRHGDLAELLAVNVLGLRMLLECLHAEIAHARIAVIGSAAELGRVKESRVPVDESFVCEPVDDYGVSKLAQSGIAHVHALRGQAIVRLRVFNLIGPAMPESLLPGRCVRLLKGAKGSNVPVRMDFGPLSTCRDYIDVRDVADAVVLGLTNGQTGALYHIGSGVSRRGEQLVEDLIVESGLAHVTYQSGVLADHALVPWQAANCGLARADLDWRPSISWRTSLQDLLGSI